MTEPSALHELQAAAGAIDGDRLGQRVPLHFGNPTEEHEAAHHGAVLLGPADEAQIEIVGPEADRFLHNLTTNDILKLVPGQGCEAFLATHTAKAVAFTRIFRLPSAGKAHRFWLEEGPGRGPFVFKHIDRHLISEDVELFDRSATTGLLRVVGPGAAALLQGLGLEVAALGPSLSVVAQTDGALRQLRRDDRFGLPGFNLLLDRAALPEWWQRLRAAGARPTGFDVEELLRVEAGMPRYGVDIDEGRFVVEVGRGPAAISTDKGCYLGQEPIVMARDRGQVNRAFLGLRPAAGVELPVGAKLFQGTTEVGLVTSSVVSPRFGPIGLGYVRRGHQAPGTALEIETAAGRGGVVVSTLPFQGP
jgi:folate-binding protein YgfZ